MVELNPHSSIAHSYQLSVFTKLRLILWKKTISTHM